MTNDHEKSDAMAILEHIEEQGKQTHLAVQTLSKRVDDVVVDIGFLKKEAKRAQSADVDHEKAIADVRREALEKARKSSHDLSEFKQEVADKDGALLKHLATLAERQGPMLDKISKNAKPALTLAGGFTGAALANFLVELARNPAPIHALLKSLGF